MAKRIVNKESLKGYRKNLRNNSTSEEIILWKFIKGSQLGYKFRRQHSIHNCILDFYCAPLKLAIELDGQHHYTPEGIEKDKKRDYFLKSQEIVILRIENVNIRENLKMALTTIEDLCKEIEESN